MQYIMYIRPAENFCVVTLQTPLKFLGQNLIGDQFGGRSEATKVCPQAILGPGATPHVSPLAPGPKIAWVHTSLAPKLVSNQILA